jgi:hypothetical protein
MPDMLSVPKALIIDLLRNLPENEVMGIFQKVLMKTDTEQLSPQEKEIVDSAKLEYEAGECLNWDDIR